MRKLFVIIPTRNRKISLLQVLDSLDEQTYTPNLVIIIDSSDEELDIDSHFYPNLEIKLISTNIKSAAVQRNIGLDELRGEEGFVAFLDDDTFPSKLYLEQLYNRIEDLNCVGVSGVTQNKFVSSCDGRSRGIPGIFRKLFMLDSAKDGMLLRSGIGIPVRNFSNELVKVSWLISCSIWNLSKIRDLRFEKDFIGQSLGEDVIFSYRASKIGDLYVDSRVKLRHDESEIGRPNEIELQSMWVTNRFRLIQIMGSTNLNLLSFWWSNLGRFTYVLANLPLRPRRSLLQAMGLFLGFNKVCRVRR